jgi:hypothetical protein
MHPYRKCSRRCRGVRRAHGAAETARLLAHRSATEPATPYEDLNGPLITAPYIRVAGARWWLSLRPQKAVAMLEDALRRWPPDRTRDRGLHQTRLAQACAATDEPERGCHRRHQGT